MTIWLKQRVERALADAAQRNRIRELAPDPNAAYDFSTNDYLQLSRHPELHRAATHALQKWGTGARASRLVGGNLEIHEQLEAELASFLAREKSLVFPSGWQMNCAVLSALATKDDLIILDRFCHNSLIVGARLSGAAMTRFAHNNLESLERILTENDKKQKYVVTESVFSMEGDAAPLAQIQTLCRQYDAIFIVDEAHALGVLGPQGRGRAWSAGLGDLILGTFGKAAGAGGAFVAGSEKIIAFLINFCHGFIFSTALAPPTAAAALQAIRLFPQLDQQRDQLATLSTQMRQKLYLEQPIPTPIIPILVGSDENLLRVRAWLADHGVRCGFIRPPTVPEGTARLRLSLHSDHTPETIDHIVELWKECKTSVLSP